MTKATFQQLRVTPEQKAVMAETCNAGGWVSVSDMIRDLVNQAAQRQSEQPHPASEQPPRDPQPDAPQL